MVITTTPWHIHFLSAAAGRGGVPLPRQVHPEEPARGRPARLAPGLRVNQPMN